MTPDEALEMQIARYREMTPEERVKIALGLHDLACEMARLGHPPPAPSGISRRSRVAAAKTSGTRAQFVNEQALLWTAYDV